MAQLPPNAGALVGKRLGKYEILALLALGGTAEIYLARIAGVAGFEKYVVVKCLHDHLADDGEFVRMFLDEARLGAKLDHSNIVQTLELGEQDNRYYMVMEYLTGMSLSLISRKVAERVPGKLIPVDLTLGLAAQAAAGLHYAHERSDTNGRALNIVHRDISPQNLVVSFEGMLKLVDFGIAKASVRDTRTKSGTIKGKFAYMSPEQCLADKDVDRRTDVFALGVVVHELITGQRLFKRQSTYDTYHAILACKVPLPSTINRSLDAAIDEVVMRALQKDRHQRYPTAEAFGDALQSALHKRGKSVSASSVSQFFDQYFSKEIAEHGARMRALIAGRQQGSVDEQWDEGADEVDDSVSDSGVAAQPEQGAGRDAENSAMATLSLGDDGDDDDGGGATRIELNPLVAAQLAHQNRGAERAATEADPKFSTSGPTRSMDAVSPAGRPSESMATVSLNVSDAQPAQSGGGIFDRAGGSTGRAAGRASGGGDDEDDKRTLLFGAAPDVQQIIAAQRAALAAGQASGVAPGGADDEDGPTMIAPGQGQGPAVSSAVRSSGPSGIAGHDDEDGPTMIAPGDDVDEDAETLRPGQQSLAQAIAAANKMGVATPGLTAGHDDRTLMPGQASLDKIKASLQQQGDAAGAAIAATLALNVNQGGQLSGQGRPQPGQQGGSRPRLPGVQQPDELTDMTDELEEASEFTSKPFQPPPGSNPSQPPPGNTPFQPPPGIAPPPGVNMPNSMPMRAQPVPYGSSQQLLAAPGPPGWMQQEPAKSTPVWLIVVAFLISVGVGMGVTILIAN